jgi:hypothetical protein
MQLYKLENIHLAVQEHIFKESSFLQFLAALLFAGMGIGMFLWNRFGNLPFFVIVISGIFLALFSIICFRHLAKTLTPTNWLVAVGPDRIIIKFRSYLNPHLPADDPQVVSLSFSEIEAAQITKEKIRYYGSQKNSKTTEYQTYLDLLIKAVNLQPLRKRLKYERSIKTYKNSGIYKYGTKSHHYPVSVPEDKIIRIQWRGPGSYITPGVKKAADLLARQHIIIRPVQRQFCDFTKRAVQEGAKADDKILELAEKGKIFAAIRLAKQVYDYDTTQARQFVESLLK